MEYKNTQRGTLIICAMIIGALTFLGIARSTVWYVWVVTGALLLVAWLFGSMTIHLTATELRWWFGPGILRTKIALEDIASARAVQTNVLEGWGIHYTRFGWLYNVSGFDAVTDRTGKRFALGTNQPNELLRALERQGAGSASKAR
ncbi:MAG TPA: hypothetical protein VEH27_14095 [Methylomirabilota bacterium]|nr:hypothetical protein [Methylomirabilota bacterium]